MPFTSNFDHWAQLSDSKIYIRQDGEIKKFEGKEVAFHLSNKEESNSIRENGRILPRKKNRLFTKRKKIKKTIKRKQQVSERV